jgi:hypothetical protein
MQRLAERMAPMICSLEYRCPMRFSRWFSTFSTTIRDSPTFASVASICALVFIVLSCAASCAVKGIDATRREKVSSFAVFFSHHYYMHAHTKVIDNGLSLATRLQAIILTTFVRLSFAYVGFLA